MSQNLTAGSNYPLGATIDSNGVNFAVYAPKAEKVVLCLFRNDTEEEIIRLNLPARTGKVWHGHLKDVSVGQLYGYRVYGENKPELGNCFDENKLLIDPYAKKLNKAQHWNERLYQGDSQLMMAKCEIADNDFDWQGVSSPEIPDSSLILYETHVKGYTKLNPHIDERFRGKYLGLCQPKVLEHLKQLGVNCIQLMPVAAFMPEPYIVNKGLTNFWGYNPVNFFAPDPRYAIDDSISEFKVMVRELHRNGFKVILDVVYNHTAESGLDGPSLSFRGFDNKEFYLFENDPSGGLDFTQHKNNSGCGNSVNMDTPFVLNLVLDAMRYWVSEMGVDGFRFDLAASLGREHREFNSSSAFFKAVNQDPVLNQCILVAEPWDIGHGGYRLGQFPANWHECNDKYRDTVRAFWRGEKGLLGEFATRLLGSRDVFPKTYKAIQTSVNYIAYHDGFTLHDLVSYNERHNMANGEHNRDGHGHNLSFNYGAEGETGDPSINEIRQQQKRNLLTSLFLSQGIPHFLAGDEINRTQRGNNNAYCQDNEISWLNWKIEEKDQQMLAFVQRIIKIRQQNALLNNLQLEDDHFYHHDNSHIVNWYRRDGQCKDIHDWLDEDKKSFVLELKSEASDKSNEHLLLLCNGSEVDKNFKLAEGCWQLLIDTRYPTGIDGNNSESHQRSYTMLGRTMALFACKMQ